VPILTS